MPAAPLPVSTKGITLDKRQAIGAALGLLCIGILLGFKLGSGEPLVIEKPIFVERPGPCADCAEKAIQAARVATEPQHATPGDSSVPPDPMDTDA